MRWKFPKFRLVLLLLTFSLSCLAAGVHPNSSNPIIPVVVGFACTRAIYLWFSLRVLQTYPPIERNERELNRSEMKNKMR